MTTRLSIVIILLLFSCSGLARAQQAAEVPDIAALVGQLGAAKVRLRDEAEARLRLLPDAVPALEEAAASHPSAEGRARAGKILRSLMQNRWHLSADLADGHLPGFSRPPLKIAVRADAGLFLTQGQDNACLWDATTLKPLRRFGKSNGLLQGWESAAPMNGFDLSPDGRTAITSDDYGYLQRTEVASGKMIEAWRQYEEEFGAQAPFNIKAVFSVSYTPDGKHIVTGGRGGWLAVLDAETCKRVKALQISVHTYTLLLFSPDGRWLLAIEDFSGDPDYIAVIRTEDWELVARQPIRDLFRSGVFLDGGTRLLGAGRNGYIATWDFDPETGMIGAEREWMRYGAGITGMLLGKDEKSVILSTGKTGLALAELDLETRKVLWSQPALPGVAALAHLGEDRFISSGWDHRIRVWKRTPATVAQPPPPLVRTLADRTVPEFRHALRLESRPHSEAPEVVDAMIYLPESGVIVTRGHDKVQVSSADDLTALRAFGPKLSRLSGMKDRSNNGALAVLPDGRTVVVTDDEGSLLFYDVETGEELRRWKAPQVETEGVVPGLQTLVWQIAVDGENGRLYTTDDSARLHEWDLETGEVLRSVQLPGVGYELVLSPDGERLAVLSGKGEAIEQLFLRTTDLKADVVFKMAMYCHNTVGSFNGDGEKFYRTFLDGRVMALQLAENARPPIDILFRIPGQPVDIQLSDDGNTAWVGVAEGPIPLSLWDLETNQPLWMADSADLPVWRIVPLPGGRVVCLCRGNVLRMYVATGN